MSRSLRQNKITETGLDHEDGSDVVSIGSRIIFISDVHLGAFDASTELVIEQDLMGLIDYAEMESYRICILGDFFDYWIDYRGKVPALATNIQRRLHSFNARFGPSYYITGNHDNWGNETLLNLGFIPVTEYLILDMDGKRIFLFHGDGLAEKDLDFPRPLFHRFIRNRYFVASYKRMLPSFAGIALMKQFSRMSRAVSRKNENEQTYRLDNWSGRLLSAQRLDGVICGHHHYPRHWVLEDGFYINLGNFFRDRTMAVCNNGCFSLVKWLAASRKLTRLESTTPVDE